MSKTTAPKGAISLTMIDQTRMIYGTPNTRYHVVLPVARIDEIREAAIGDLVANQAGGPVAISGSVVIKVNGERLYVAEKPGLIRDLINSVS